MIVSAEWKEWKRKKPGIFRRIKWKLQKYWNNLTRIPRFLWKLGQYAVFLWDDFDWDYVHLLYTLKFKITRMHKHMAEHNIIEGTPKYVRQMKFAVLLIDRIIEDNYKEKEQKALDEKWGKIIMLERPYEGLEGGHYIDFTREKCQTEADKEQEREETRALYEAARQAREKDLDRLFRHLRKYIQYWWD